jgi:iron complex transport system ATP-binding protein
MSSSTVLTTEKLAINIADKTICHDLDITVHKGECWAILGQNGTGKTTLLHTLAGLHTSNGGQVQLKGKPLNSLSSRIIAQQCGLLLQDYQDIFPATVMEAVLIGRHPHLSAWQWESDNDKQIAQQALSTVDLAGMEQRSLQSLSGGERRRVAIAAVLAQQPEIFLLDEPANHLDIKHQYQVLKLFSQKTYNKEKAVMMVLHDINLAASYCSHALLMFADNTIETGTTDEMLTEEKLTALYQHPIRKIESEKTIFMPN